ncbi:hypothetical protein Tco_1431142 [Tanacetum coccineum]
MRTGYKIKVTMELEGEPEEEDLESKSRKGTISGLCPQTMMMIQYRVVFPVPPIYIVKGPTKLFPLEVGILMNQVLDYGLTEAAERERGC